VPKQEAEDRTGVRQPVRATTIILTLAAITVLVVWRRGKKKYAQGYIDGVQYCCRSHPRG
jgi:hypothetical protein